MDLQSALELLYTDESLAADLDDQTAGPFLKWAESQLPSVLSRSAAQSADGEEPFTAFRRLLKLMARYVAASAEGDTASAAQRVDQLRALASQLALSTPVEALIQSTATDGPTLVTQLSAVPATPTDAQTVSDAQHGPVAAADETVDRSASTYTLQAGPAPQSEGQIGPPAQELTFSSASPTRPETPAPGGEHPSHEPAPDEPQSPRNLFDMLRRAIDDARAAKTPNDKE